MSAESPSIHHPEARHLTKMAGPKRLTYLYNVLIPAYLGEPKLPPEAMESLLACLEQRLEKSEAIWDEYISQLNTHLLMTLVFLV